jgi:hypothetical protein
LLPQLSRAATIFHCDNKKTSRQDSVVLVTEPDTGEFIRKDTGEDVSSDNVLSQEKEWRAFELEGDISRARTEAPNFLAFHDMGVSTIVRVPHAVGGRGGIIYHKCAYYDCIIIIGTSGGSTTTLDHGLGWNFPSKIALDIPLHHIASLLPNGRRYNMTKRPLSCASAHPKRGRGQYIQPAGQQQ